MKTLALDLDAHASAVAVIDPAKAFHHPDGTTEAALAFAGLETCRSDDETICVRLQGRDSQTLDLVLDPAAAEALGLALIRAATLTADDYPRSRQHQLAGRSGPMPKGGPCRCQAVDVEPVEPIDPATIPAGDRTALEVASGPDRFCATVDLCRACYHDFRRWLAAAAGDDAA